MISARISRGTRTAKPATIGMWLGVLTALLFVFQINFVHVHLLTETHLDGSSVAAADVTAHEGEHDESHHHDSDHHQPHSASDHLLQMATKHQAPAFAITLLPVESLICLIRPDSLVVRVVVESGIAPGESPPDPLQPRAPPLA